jgi:hypothetical protein
MVCSHFFRKTGFHSSKKCPSPDSRPSPMLQELRCRALALGRMLPSTRHAVAMRASAPSARAGRGWNQGICRVEPDRTRHDDARPPIYRAGATSSRTICSGTGRALFSAVSRRRPSPRAPLSSRVPCSLSRRSHNPRSRPLLRRRIAGPRIARPRIAPRTGPPPRIRGHHSGLPRIRRHRTGRLRLRIGRRHLGNRLSAPPVRRDICCLAGRGHRRSPS